ncbi:MAG: CPXCG motif-containing cysteine-rich protein [Bdellovibrionota bacterium]
MLTFDLAEQLIRCPYCGESLVVEIDPSVSFQEYIEDCQVCCRPIVFHVQWSEEDVSVKVKTDCE